MRGVTARAKMSKRMRWENRRNRGKVRWVCWWWWCICCWHLNQTTGECIKCQKGSIHSPIPQTNLKNHATTCKEKEHKRTAWLHASNNKNQISSPLRWLQQQEDKTESKRREIEESRRTSSSSCQTEIETLKQKNLDEVGVDHRCEWSHPELQWRN